MSDVQRDGARPNKFRKIVNDGVIDCLADTYGQEPADALSFAMIPGDVAVTGNVYSQWQNHFFEPGAKLWESVPLYPVMGNHDGDGKHLTNYFRADVSGGDGPHFTLTRVSPGDPSQVLDNEVNDTLTVHRHNRAPGTPTARAQSQGGGQVLLSRSQFRGSGNYGYGATQWQVARSCGNFNSPIVDVWIQDQNIYKDRDLLAGRNHAELSVSLDSGRSYCVRIRVRDKSLAWSDWSSPVAFNA